LSSYSFSGHWTRSRCIGRQSNQNLAPTARMSAIKFFQTKQLKKEENMGLFVLVLVAVLLPFAIVGVCVMLDICFTQLPLEPDNYNRIFVVTTILCSALLALLFMSRALIQNRDGTPNPDSPAALSTNACVNAAAN